MAKAISKSKLNRKFVLLLGGFLVFTALVLGGIFFWSQFAAPERNMRLGDELVIAATASEATGDADEAYKKFNDALGRYGRAVVKKPNNLQYLQKMIDTLRLMTPITSGDAEERFRTLQSLLMKRALVASSTGQQWVELLGGLTDVAHSFGANESWQQVADTCDDALAALPPSDPEISTIQGMRVYANLKREEILTDSQRTDALTAADDFLKSAPKNEQLWGAYLRTLSDYAGRLAIANQGGLANAVETDYDRVLAAANAAVPNSPFVALAEVEHLLSQRRLRNPLATPSAITAILNPLLWKGGDRNSPHAGTASNIAGRELANLADAALQVDDSVALERTILILSNYCSNTPNSLLELSMLIQLQKRNLQEVAALATCERLIASPEPKVSLIAALSNKIRFNVLEEIFTIQYAAWQAAKTPQEQTAAMVRAVEARDRLAKFMSSQSDDLALVRADAKLAFARGDFLTAVSKLEDIFARQNNVAPEYYLFSAISLGARGENGAALVKIRRATEDYPNIPQFYSIQAELEAKLGRLNDAKRSIAKLLAIDPNNAEGILIRDQLSNAPAEGAVNFADLVVKVIGNAEVLAAEGQIGEAIDRCKETLLLYPKDVRLERQIVQWLLFASRLPEAKQAVDEFVIDHPTDPYLAQLKILVDIPSPVERLKKFIAMPASGGRVLTPAMRAVALAVGLSGLRDALTTRLSIAGASDKGPLTEQLATATAEARVAVASALELEPGDPTLIDQLLKEALLAKDQPRLDELIVRAEQHCKDRSIPLLLRGRIALERKDFASAITVFEAATALPIATAAAYRLLGIARASSGDIEGAREAYATAYERQPDDVITISLYSDLLARSGQITQARGVLRNAMLALPQSSAIRNAYFTMEAVYGNRAASIIERRQVRQIRPADVENSRQLMSLLIDSPLSREFIMNSDGTAKYPVKEWDAMDRGRQKDELAAVGEANFREGRAIFDALMKMNSQDQLTIRTFGAAMYRGGRGSEAAVMLKSFAEAATGPNAWKSWLDLGELQMEAGYLDEATRCFEKAVELDGSPTSSAARLVAQRWSARRNPQRGLDILEQAYSKNKSVEVVRMLIPMRVEVRDFAGAHTMMKELSKLTGDVANFSDRLLTAEIANAEIEDSFSEGASGASGSSAASVTSLAEFNKAIDDAIRLDPSSPIPFLARASSSQRRFQRTGDVEFSRQAKDDARRAIELRGNYWPATRLLASILVDANSIATAVQLVRQFIEQYPRENDARKALIAYLATAGDFLGAINIAKEAVQLEPKNPEWLRALAETYLLDGNNLEAANTNDQIFEITQNSTWLMQSVMLRATNSPPDFRGILVSMRSAPELVATDPFLQMVGAAALAGTGETDIQRNQGKLQLRELFKLVVESKGSLLEPWMIAATSLFPPSQSVEFEKFVLEAAATAPDCKLSYALAQRLVLRGSSSYSKALEYAKRAVELSAAEESKDDKFLAQLILGNTQYALGNQVEAAAAFAKCLEIDSENIMAINNLAYLEAKILNKVPESIARSRKALAKSPTNADLMDTLGFALIKSGELPEAISLLRRSARAKPTAIVFAHLALAQAIAGRSDEANESIERAKALKPDADATAAIDEVVQVLDKGLAR